MQKKERVKISDKIKSTKIRKLLSFYWMRERFVYSTPRTHVYAAKVIRCYGVYGCIHQRELML
ncbi:hypothetical protein OTUT144_0598 [Orientia tsutsugamushi str. UT144]|uniref:Uncharacterized protein n=1 Tax=Orientia tsutsugamushi str. UT144 TaxID=1441384 RepID=A0A0F3RMV3_ORITS|nr:hypothetical protein OTUT144_0598 [Orientia tsutsugamushi str. UT144]